MKNIFMYVFITFFVLFLTGCNSVPKAIITNNEGKKEELTSMELVQVNKENEEKFKKYYTGAKISFDGTILNVKSRDDNCYSYTGYEREKSGFKSTNGSSYYDKNGCTEINFEEGYRLLIPSKGILEVAGINVKDKYHVETNIIISENDYIVCFGLDNESENKAVKFNTTKIYLIE